MTTTVTSLQATARPPSEIEGRRTAPVKAWAVVGAAFVVLAGLVVASWLLDHPVKTPTGVDEVPGWMKGVLIGYQIISVIGLVAVIYWKVYRPWRREGEASFDGLLVLALLTCFWQDTLCNYVVTWVTYNSYMVNLGAWNTKIPGWLSPHGNLVAEPLLGNITTYAWVILPWIALGNYVMRKAKQRWPQLGTLGLLGVAFLFMAVSDAVLETTMMRLGIWTYAGAISSLTINAGKYYQYPLYEGVFWGSLMAMWAGFRYFRNDKGESIAERGTHDLRVSRRGRTWLRFLAITGFVQATMLFAYSMPSQFVAIHSEPWPKDITSRSYFTNGFCGEGTTYACSGPANPIPRPKSARVGPDGQLIPAGTARCVEDAAVKQIPSDLAAHHKPATACPEP